ncbi:MAG: VWA domain-containing protein [Lentisphaeraceae bacterium]|nr:VWA domain-containing protein [Lentisphaeraceae bacterium]
MKKLLFSLIVLISPLYASQNVVVVLDDSGSMNERMKDGTSKVDAAKRALTKVLSSLDGEDNLGVLLLNKGWLIKLGPVKKDLIAKKVKSFHAHGHTPLAKSMKEGTDALLKLRGEIHYGTYRLLVVTDGVAKNAKLVDRYVNDIMSRGVTVDVIGVDMAKAHSLATKVHTYRKADDPASLEKAVSMVFGEITSTDTVASDFDMLKGFPDEIAAESLKALSIERNHPVGTKLPVASKRVVNSSAPTNSGSRASAADPAPVAEKDSSGGLPMPLIVIGIIMIGAFIKKIAD